VSAQRAGKGRSDRKLFTYLARQPIFDRQQEIKGYELLYRDGRSGNMANIYDDDAATRGVLSDALTVFGLSSLTRGRPAFVNFTRNLLLGDFAQMADPGEIIIELSAGEEFDSRLTRKLIELQRAGYILALDGYTGDARLNQALSLFPIVKVDFRQAGETACRDIAKRLGHTSTRLLAEKVETAQEFDAAVKLGFHLFQGYFLEKPTCLSKHIPSLAAATYGRLINTLLRPAVDFDECSRIVETDVTLTYLMLRRVRTAQYYRGNVISGIKQAMVMMGTEELRRWICLVLTRQSNVTHSDTLPKQAFVRGRFIEELMRHSKDAPNPQEGFLMGMFSLLDQVTGTAIDNLLEDLSLAQPLKDALLGRGENVYSRFLQYALVYEMANKRLLFPDIRLTCSKEMVSDMYEKALQEANTVFQGRGGRGH